MNSESTPPPDSPTSAATDEIVMVEVPAAVGTDELRKILREAMDSGAAHIVVDLSADNHPNSMKIGVLIRFKNRAVRRGGDLRLLGAGGRTLEMLRITRLDTVFRLFEDEQSARRSFA